MPKLITNGIFCKQNKQALQKSVKMLLGVTYNYGVRRAPKHNISYKYVENIQNP